MPQVLQECWLTIQFGGFRYAYPGDVAARHPAHARQCPAALFLCVLHLWHHRCPIVGGHPATALHTAITRLHTKTKRVSTAPRASTIVIQLI